MKMRICIIVDDEGNWVAEGYARQVEKEIEDNLQYTVGPKNVVRWVEVNIPCPHPEMTTAKKTPFPRYRGHRA